MENSVQEQRSRINELKCQIEALGNSDKPASAIQSALAELQEVGCSLPRHLPLASTVFSSFMPFPVSLRSRQ